VNKVNDITSTTEIQALNKKLNKILLEKLPQSLDETAKQHGVLVRIRKIQSGYELIKVMIIYALMNLSQRLLAAFASLVDAADISDQAWQKKL
jgi:hypothetical protein